MAHAEKTIHEHEVMRPPAISEGIFQWAVVSPSRASGNYTAVSDWDIAVQWQRSDGQYLDHLANMECLRCTIARELGISPEQVDLIDVPAAKLAMRELICNEGVVLAGENSLPWIHFLQRTWRDLEDYYWDELYVAFKPLAIS